MEDTTGTLANGGFDSGYNWSGWADANGNDVDLQADCSNVALTQCVEDNGVVYRVET